MLLLTMNTSCFVLFLSYAMCGRNVQTLESIRTEVLSFTCASSSARSPLRVHNSWHCVPILNHHTLTEKLLLCWLRTSRSLLKPPFKSRAFCHVTCAVRRCCRVPPLDNFAEHKLQPALCSKVRYTSKTEMCWTDSQYQYRCWCIPVFEWCQVSKWN